MIFPDKEALIIIEQQCRDGTEAICAIRWYVEQFHQDY